MRYKLSVTIPLGIGFSNILSAKLLALGNSVFPVLAPLICIFFQSFLKNLHLSIYFESSEEDIEAFSSMKQAILRLYVDSYV